MERAREITRAKEVVRALSTRLSKPGNRIHANAAMDNTNRLRALEGLCGRCTHLNLRFGRVDGKNVVTLSCSKDHNPSVLYENTPWGEQAFCEDYRKVQ